MKKTLHVNGVSGKVYTFDVSSKKTKLPDEGGVYILTYSHPRGHLAGFQVNVLRMGATSNLNSATAELRLDNNLREECWNYTCTITLNDPEKRDEYIEDLRHNTLIQC